MQAYLLGWQVRQSVHPSTHREPCQWVPLGVPESVKAKKHFLDGFGARLQQDPVALPVMRCVSCQQQGSLRHAWQHEIPVRRQNHSGLALAACR